MVKTSVRSLINARILQALQQGIKPWQCPWSNSRKINTNIGLPTNVRTGNLYRGVNPLLLNIVAGERGYQSKWWATEKQWGLLGCKVKNPPEHINDSRWAAIAVVYVPARGNRYKPVVRRYRVYNAEQVINAEKFMAVNGEIRNYEAATADRLAAATNANIVYGCNAARYIRPPIDRIELPARSSFESDAFFMATRHHELMHWSESRVGWKGSYGLGELIAEIGSMYLNDFCGVPLDVTWDNNISYLGQWARAIREDDTAIFRATMQASVSVDFILGLYHKSVNGA